MDTIPSRQMDMFPSRPAPFRQAREPRIPAVRAPRSDAWWHALRRLPRSAVTLLPGACLALGGLAVVGDIELEAAQRQVPTEALELDLAVAVGGTDADGCMAKLVQVPG